MKIMSFNVAVVGDDQRIVRMTRIKSLNRRADDVRDDVRFFAICVVKSPEQRGYRENGRNIWLWLMRRAVNPIKRSKERNREQDTERRAHRANDWIIKTCFSLVPKVSAAL